MKSIFSPSVIKSINRVFNGDIAGAVIGSPDLKREIQKTLQQANRRIQNVQNAGLASPAVKAVIAERGQKEYSYFSVSGLDSSNPTQWEQMKYEYGRALAFLNNPTSTATGARQYIRYQARQLNNIPFESANKIVDLATSPTIDEYGNVNIYSYGRILDKYKNDIKQVGDDMKKTAEQYAADIEAALRSEIAKIANGQNDSFLDRFF